MDFDIEMGDAADAYPGEADPYTGGAETVANDVPQEDILDVDQEPGEIEEDTEPAGASGAYTGAATSANPDDSTSIPNKVHIRGLDTLNPDDIKAYIAEHCGAVSSFNRIEWIDDSSANILFSSASTASAALVALAAIPIDDPAQLPLLEMLPAKPYSAKPDAAPALQIRMAVASDKKQVGAAARSRFYLLHPEYDPEERRRNRGYRDRDSYRDGGRGRDRDRDYRSRHRSGRRRDDRYDDGNGDDRDEDIRNNAFDVSLYDDDESALASRRRSRRSRSRSSWSSLSSGNPRNNDRNRDKELFPSGGSANNGRELFPGNDAAKSSSNNSSKELFPVKELFPDKMGERLAKTTRGGGRAGGGSRRRDNRSASPQRDGHASNNHGNNNDDDYDGRLADERAEAAAAAASRNRDKARAIKDELSSRRNGRNNRDGSRSRELFPSGSGGAHMDLYGGGGVAARLSESYDNDENDGSTFNIRGLAGSSTTGNSHSNINNGSQGFSIKGAASARELFPDKLNNPNGNNGSGGGDLESRISRGRNRNSGKEIFSDKLENRIRPRRRAEDMFH